MTVTVYTRPSCVQCTATYRALDNKGVQYEVRDVSSDDVALEQVKASATCRPRSSSPMTTTGLGSDPTRSPPSAHEHPHPDPHRAKAEVEPIAEFEPVSIKRGHPIELVRWWHGEDGWGYDLVQGRYRRRDRDTVTVDVDGSSASSPATSGTCAPHEHRKAPAAVSKRYESLQTVVPHDDSPSHNYAHHQARPAPRGPQQLGQPRLRRTPHARLHPRRRRDLRRRPREGPRRPTVTAHDAPRSHMPPRCQDERTTNRRGNHPMSNYPPQDDNQQRRTDASVRRTADRRRRTAHLGALVRNPLPQGLHPLLEEVRRVLRPRQPQRVLVVVPLERDHRRGALDHRRDHRGRHRRLQHPRHDELHRVSAGAETQSPASFILALWYLAILIPTIAIQIRRLHDINFRGW